jgi:hypothetical protein
VIAIRLEIDRQILMKRKMCSNQYSLPSLQLFLRSEVSYVTYYYARCLLPSGRFHPSVQLGVGVAIGGHRACGIGGVAGITQIASCNSSNAVARRYTGAISTPSSY